MLPDVWLTEEGKLLKSEHATFQLEKGLLDIVGVVKAVDVSDGEDKPTGEGAGQPAHGLISSKRSSPDSGLCRFSWLARRRWARKCTRMVRNLGCQRLERREFLRRCFLYDMTRRRGFYRAGRAFNRGRSAVRSRRQHVARPNGWRASSTPKKGSFTDVVLHTGTKPITTQFVFEIKRAADGTVERYKTRLVARGFT